MADHGTRSRYVEGCRCDPCKTANRRHQRDLRAKRRGLDDFGTSEPGPVEQAARDEMATLSAAANRPGDVACVVAMARILDDPEQYPTHPRASGVMDRILKKLRAASGERARRGRLVSVHQFREKRK
ncbi:hypothetical protein ACAG26_06720 [Mycobacterium sp. pUA109]|uniref:hypothetical protein n=1 Tax=Mycobacterium sp. pUA109 TaxID=3238982 RepID=UPI00351B1A44